MSTPLRCLIIEDSEDDAVLLVRRLRDFGYAVTSERVETAAAMQAALDRQSWDIVISDYKMLQFSGPAALELLKASGLDLPFIIVSGTVGEEQAVEAMKAGAHDYLIKGKLARFVPVVQRELHEANERRERKHAENWARLTGAALTAAGNAIVITDRDGIIEWTNPAFSKLTGYSLAEAVGRNPHDLVKSGEHDNEVYQNMWNTILAGRVWHGELVNRRKDGSLYSEEQTITPVLGARGEIAHFVAIKQDLTERKRAESALRESAALFHSLVEQVPAGVFRKDPAGRYVFVSPWFCRLKGLPAEEFLGKTPSEVAHSEAARQDATGRAVKHSTEGEDHHHLIMQSGKPLERLEEYTLADGRKEFIHAIKSPVINQEGKTIGTQGILFDITELKLAEESLRQEQSLFNSLISTIPDHIYFKDRQSRFIRINHSMAKNFGLHSPAEAIGKTDADFFTEAHAKPAYEAEQQVMETGEPIVGLEETETWPDGRVTWASSTKMPLRDAAGRITGLVGISRNITERKAVEQQLREQHEILSKSHEGVMIVNLENKVTLWNHAAEALFGWTAAEALDTPPERLIGVDDLGAVATLRAAVARDGYWNGELRGQARDGRKLILDCRTSLIRNEAGEPIARLNTVSDVTEKKQLEEKYLHAQRLESLGMLAAGIAHDLNNVLAPILFAAPLLRKSVSSARDLKILDTLERSGERGSGLVKLILGFAHSTTGGPRLTHIKHIARDVISMIEETFPRNIRVEHQISPDAWPILCNPTQIHQVLLNLCVNARDAMPQGGTLHLRADNRRLTVEEAAPIPEARPGSWLVVEVGDTGTGIPPAVLEHIWDAFFTTKGAGKGTGLGLSTVRSIVATHRGFVQLQTEVGHGTTFRVFLPGVENEKAASVSISPFDIPEGQGEMILVVDDDQAVRDVVRAMLQRHNYRVLCCNDGVEAIDLFSANLNEFVLVVTDVDMPNLGGAGLIRVLLQLRPDLRVLAISGLARSETEAAIPAARKLAHAFLQKPFKFEELLVAVHRLLHPPEST